MMQTLFYISQYVIIVMCFILAICLHLSIRTNDKLKERLNKEHENTLNKVTYQLRKTPTGLSFRSLGGFDYVNIEDLFNDICKECYVNSFFTIELNVTNLHRREDGI